MVSLAFVISFVVSAVAMVLGIIIFSDVVEGLEITLPVLDEGADVTVQAGSLVDNSNHHFSSLDSVKVLPNTESVTGLEITGMTVSSNGLWQGLGNMTDPDRWDYNMQQTSGVPMSTMSASQNADHFVLSHVPDGGNGNGWFFKSFNKNDIGFKDLYIEWSYAESSSSHTQVYLYDGYYSIENYATHFSVSTVPNAQDSGHLQSSTQYNSPFGKRTELILPAMNTAGSTNSNGWVTIFIKLHDGCGSCSASIQVDRLWIVDPNLDGGLDYTLAEWDFGTDTSANANNVPNACTFNCGTNTGSFDNVGGSTTYPVNYELGIYDSADNLLGSKAGIMSVAGDMSVTFDTPITPADDNVSYAWITDKWVEYNGEVGAGDTDCTSTAITLEDPMPALDVSCTINIITNVELESSLAPVNSEGDLKAHENFDSTVSTAMTVLGIFPIVLFFALFTVLSPKVDGEE